MNELVLALQQTLAQDIPITQHMGITIALTIARYDEQGLVLKAPLAGNTNPKGTAFAGCINSLTTLAGWGSIWLLLKELHIDGQVELDVEIRQGDEVAVEFKGRYVVHV